MDLNADLLKPQPGEIMKTKKIISKIINGVFRRIGYELSSVNDNFSIKSALSRRVINKTVINSVIDVGASNGSWSKLAKQFFPEAFYFLIEANHVHEPDLATFKSNNSKVDYVIVAAGDSSGEIYFDAQDPFGGQASHSPSTPDDVIVPMTTIDKQVTQKSLSPPFLLKLDTHGFEIPILNGANHTLKNTNLIIIETYNFKLAPDCLRFWEICHHMELHGFRPIDFCDPMRRPKDQALWQMDILFIPCTNQEFESNSYS